MFLIRGRDCRQQREPLCCAEDARHEVVPTGFPAELSLQLEGRGILLEVNWVPREQNTEADAITNGDFGWLKAENKISTVIGQLPFIVLPELLSKGEGFYSGSETVNVGAPPRPQRTNAP